MTMTRRRVLAAILAAMAALGVAAAGTLSPTRAAWNDDAALTASVSAGAWQQSPDPEPASPTPDPTETGAEGAIWPGEETTEIGTPQWVYSGDTSSTGASSATNPNMGVCATLTLTSTSSEWERWSLVVDLDQQPFNGQGATMWSAGQSQVTISQDPSSPSRLIITGTGSGSPTDNGWEWNSSWNNAYLNTDHHITIKLCTSTTGVPPEADSSWYSVSTQNMTWTDTQACVAITITGRVTDLAATPFYFGWTTTLDLTAAKQRITGAGKTLNYVGWTPSTQSSAESGEVWGFRAIPNSTSERVPDSYQLSNGRSTSLRGTSQVTIQACVYGY